MFHNFVRVSREGYSLKPTASYATIFLYGRRYKKAGHKKSRTVFVGGARAGPILTTSRSNTLHQKKNNLKRFIYNPYKIICFYKNICPKLGSAAVCPFLVKLFFSQQIFSFLGKKTFTQKKFSGIS